MTFNYFTKDVVFLLLYFTFCDLDSYFPQDSQVMWFPHDDLQNSSS